MINLQSQVKLQGEYNIVVTRGDGTTEETGWFKNLILNQGLDRLGASSGSIIEYAQVGSGTNTPVVTDTSLQTYVASSGSVSAFTSYTNSGSPDYYGQATYVFTFTQGSVVATIGEVGVGWANTAGTNLFSRALILDGGGNPTTISVTAIDQLTVYYRLRFYPTITDTTGSVLIGATSYNYTIRTGAAGSWGNNQYIMISAPYFSRPQSAAFYEPGVALNPVTSTGMNGSFTAGTYFISQPANITSASYTTGTYYIDSTFTAGTTVANGTGGFQGMYIYWGETFTPFQFQLLFDSAIPKDNTKQFTLTLRFSWARV